MGKRNLKRISLAQTLAAVRGRGQGELALPKMFCHDKETKLSGATKGLKSLLVSPPFRFFDLPTALQCLAPSVSPCFAFPCKVSVQMACMHG